jgi:hypothetical protein
MAERPWNTQPKSPKGASWPGTILALQSRLKALDAEVARHEFCAPMLAQEARLKATMVLARIEAIKRSTLVDELDVAP